jgi:hypothetical protein
VLAAKRGGATMSKLPVIVSNVVFMPRIIFLLVLAVYRLVVT